MDGYHIRSGTVSMKINRGFKSGELVMLTSREVRKPGPDPKEFAIDIHLRRNSDGEVRVHRDEYGPLWEWQYSDGNYGCDCNRHLFFCRATGEGDEEDRDCGETAYSIVKVVRVDTGEVLSKEDPRG